MLRVEDSTSSLTKLLTELVLSRPLLRILEFTPPTTVTTIGKRSQMFENLSISLSQYGIQEQHALLRTRLDPDSRSQYHIQINDRLTYDPAIHEHDAVIFYDSDPDQQQRFCDYIYPLLANGPLTKPYIIIYITLTEINKRTDLHNHLMKTILDNHHNSPPLSHITDRPSLSLVVCGYNDYIDYQKHIRGSTKQRSIKDMLASPSK